MSSTGALGWIKDNVAIVAGAAAGLVVLIVIVIVVVCCLVNRREPVDVYPHEPISGPPVIRPGRDTSSGVEKGTEVSGLNIEWLEEIDDESIEPVA